MLKDLISVLRKTNQKINPELYNLKDSAPSRFYKPQKRYNSSFGKNKMPYGSKMTYSRNRFGDERNRMKYKKEKISYM